LFVSASGLANVSHQFEMVRLDRIGLFCAPALGLESDLALSAGGNRMQTFGCEKLEDFEGDFFNFGVSISAEALALPVGIGGIIGLGFRADALIKSVFGAVKRGEVKADELVLELDRVVNALPYGGGYPSLPFWVLTGISGAMMQDHKTALKASQELNEWYRQGEFSRSGLADLPKEMVIVAKTLAGAGFPNLGRMAALLSAQFTGCNVLGINGFASLSPVPASGQVSISRSHFLTAFDPEDLIMELAQLALPKRQRDLTLKCAEKILESTV
ncbi:MAG: hypothetical protein AAB425_00610, partial [Bdellovibrionota bacterium]